MIYFTSDLHLGHRSVLDFNNRPFSSVEEMNQVLITNFNSRVKQNDTVYILGDIIHRITVEEANKLIAKLNGNKILVKGNHDKEYDPTLFERIVDYEWLGLDGDIRIALMHYPILEWNRAHHGSYMLHGHIHSDGLYNLENKENGIRRYDVGVDANHYFPISVDEIIQFFGESFSYQRIGKM